MRGAVFAVLFLTTATCLGLDVLWYDWTEFVVLNLILLVALFVGRETVNKSHKENFEGDFMISGLVLLELVFMGLLIVYALESYFKIDLINALQIYKTQLRILMLGVIGVLGYKLGQIKDEIPTEL